MLDVNSCSITCNIVYECDKGSSAAVIEHVRVEKADEEDEQVEKRPRLKPSDGGRSQSSRQGHASEGGQQGAARARPGGDPRDRLGGRAPPPVLGQRRRRA